MQIRREYTHPFSCSAHASDSAVAESGWPRTCAASLALLARAAPSTAPSAARLPKSVRLRRPPRLRLRHPLRLQLRRSLLLELRRSLRLR